MKHLDGAIAGYDNWITGLESGEKVAWNGYVQDQSRRNEAAQHLQMAKAAE